MQRLMVCVLSVAAATGLLCLTGCLELDDRFPRAQRDDPTPQGVDDDDDSAPTGPLPPRVTVATADPTVTISGPLEIGLLVEDDDSTEVTVHVFYGHDSPDAADREATLVDATTESTTVVTVEAARLTSVP